MLLLICGLLVCLTGAANPIKTNLDSLNAILESNAHDTVKAKVYNMIGLHYYKHGEIEPTLAAWRSKLEIEVRLNNLLGMSASLNNIGTMLRRQGKLEEALDYYKRSMKIDEDMGERSDVARSLNNIGNIHKERGEVQEAWDCFQKALDIFIEEDVIYSTATCYINLGNIAKEQGRLDQALKYYHQSLDIREEFEDKLGVASSLNNIGNVHNMQDDLEMALSYYLQSVEINTEIDNKDGLSRALNNVGSIYEEQKLDKKALEMYERSLDIRKNIGYKEGIATSLNNIGHWYAMRGQPEKALEYYEQGLKLKEDMGNKEGMAISLNNIGQTYTQLGKKQRGEADMLHSLKLSRDLGNPMLIQDVSLNLYKHYKTEKQDFKALEMHELYLQMKDSLHNSEVERTLVKRTMKYEYEKRAAADSVKAAEAQKVADAQILAQEAQISKEKTFKYSLFGGLALVLIFAIYVFNRLKHSRKQNDVIAHQKELVEEKNQEVKDSILYAQRIQAAMLPPLTIIEQQFPDSFMFYLPKDIVAGDFYWVELGEEKSDTVFFSVADCTGHGVPGAMMSVMCSSALSKCVVEMGIDTPSDILDETVKILEHRFERSEHEMYDGMDLALCKFNKSSLMLEYAGAHNPLWLIRDGELREIKADSQPVGNYDLRTPYTNHIIQLQKGDSFYVFSDGYADQFGGERGKKFKSKSFKKLLLSLQDQSMKEQGEALHTSFQTWRGTIEQLDDVCVMGVRI